MSEKPQVARPINTESPRDGDAARARGPVAAAVVAVVVGLVLTFYLWLASVGTWTRWPSLTNTYDQLASAFLRGQLALLEAPDPALLALENPYDPDAREDVPFPLDVSLYEGKFYLYFGPVPAVLLAGAKAILRTEIGDEYLVFVFAAGLFIVEVLFAFIIWRRYFPRTSLLSLGIGVVALGLAAPAGWLLSTANVYGAAVLAGAFLLLAGLYAAYRALEADRIRMTGLVLAGVCWFAAVGSRMTQALTVILLTVLVLAAIVRRAREAGSPIQAGRAVAALLVPLALGAAALGWYNWARFGSVLESGIRYQLAGGFQEHLDNLFSPIYIPQNVANYFWAPPRLGYAFPYFKPTHGFRESVIAGYPLPDYYWSSQIAGLLYTAPFVAYSIVSALRALRGSGSRVAGGESKSGFKWLFAALWCAFLSGFVVFLSFFWSAERYLADFAPAWYLLSIMGFWWLGERLTRTIPGRVLHLAIAVVLLAPTFLVGNLLGMAFQADGFRELNPVLWRQLGNLFRP